MFEMGRVSRVSPVQTALRNCMRDEGSVMGLERRGQIIAVELGPNGVPGGALSFGGRRQPPCDGMSRMMREYHVRFCEGFGVKFPGPTRHERCFCPAPITTAFQ